MAQLELVAVLLTLMAYLIGGGAVHRRVVGVVLIGFEVAVVALAVEVIQRIAQSGAVVDPVIDDRTHPDRALFVAPVIDVVVVEAIVFVDLQLAGFGVEHRRAPVRAVFVFVLIFQGQGVRKIRREVAEQRERHAPGIALLAVDVAVAGVVTDVEPRVVLHVGARVGQRVVEAERGFGGVVTAVADATFGGLFVAGRQFGHVVQRAADRACAVDQRRWAAHQFDSIIDP